MSAAARAKISASTKKPAGRAPGRHQQRRRPNLVAKKGGFVPGGTREDRGSIESQMGKGKETKPPCACQSSQGPEESKKASCPPKVAPKSWRRSRQDGPK